MSGSTHLYGLLIFVSMAGLAVYKYTSPWLSVPLPVSVSYFQIVAVRMLRLVAANCRRRRWRRKHATQTLATALAVMAS